MRRRRDAGPAAGRYDAQLCVATTRRRADVAAPAEVELRANGEARVRVADIVYRLQLRQQPRSRWC